MNIIDAYCGVGPWAGRDPLLPATPADILAILDSAGIGQALIVSNLAHTVSSAADVNRTTAAFCATQPRFLPAYLLSPDPYDTGGHPEKNAGAMRAVSARAAWLRPKTQGHGMSAWQVGGLLDWCSQCHIPLFLPADALPPDRVYHLAETFPRLRLVLTDVGYRADEWLYPLLRRHGEVRVCLGPCYIPPLGPERFVAHFGCDRLIFGSGLPHYSPGGLLAHVRYAQIPEEAKQRILSGNLDDLLKEAQP